MGRRRAGDVVLLSGVVYSARDAAHARLIALLDQGQPLPFPTAGQVLYYVGPTPPRPGTPIGSAGPTTSGRMDSYTPALLAAGIRMVRDIFRIRSNGRRGLYNAPQPRP